MQKRTQLILLILAALILLAIGLYFLLTPFLAGQQAASPAAPQATTPYVTGQGGTAGTPGTEPPVYISPTSTEGVKIKGENTLENKARNIVERIGSGVSTDGFLGYTDVLGDVTANGRSRLLSEQEAMKTEHPATGAFYGISTRAASARLTEGIFGDQKVTYTVDAIQRVDMGSVAGAPSKAKSIEVTFLKQADDTYLVDSLVWSDIDL
ncbi:MAG: hypothetical protein ABIB04_04150 [Patescibacteria group bacterium]